MQNAPPGFLRLAGHPLRWRLLTELARTDRQVRELTGLPGPAAEPGPYHLGQLRAGGLVRRRAELFVDAIAACNLLPADSPSWPLLRLAGPRPGGRAGQRGLAFILPGLACILALSALFLRGHAAAVGERAPGPGRAPRCAAVAVRLRGPAARPAQLGAAE